MVVRSGRPQRVLFRHLQDLAQIDRGAKGHGPENLFFGAYSYASWDADDASSNAYGHRMTIRSQYNYRPNPVAGDSEAWPRYTDYEMVLGGTAPRAKSYYGKQFFPTQRVLGGRALLCDTWERGKVTDEVTLEMMANGKMGTSAGLQVHKDGYNVLYGDMHAEWYGDPQQRIIWWPVDLSVGCADDYATMHGAAVRYNWVYPPSGDVNTLAESHMIWHLMDVATGVDTNAPVKDADPYNTY